jgi:hypothetical protein
MRLSLTPREFGLIMDVLDDATGGDEQEFASELIATLKRQADMYYSSEPDDEDEDEGDDDD